VKKVLGIWRSTPSRIAPILSMFASRVEIISLVD
jgi:hypothetical protein